MDIKRKIIKTSGYFDYSLLFVIVFLCCFGLVMIYSASYYTAQLKLGNGAYYMLRQLRVFLLGLVFMLFVSRLDYHKYAKLWPLAWIASTILMVLTDFTPLGVELNYSKRWFGISGHALFQTSELVKIAIILTMAVLLTNMYQHLMERNVILLFAALVLIPFILVAKENLSAGIIIFGIAFSMYFVACREWKLFGILVGGGLIVVIIAVFATDKLVDAGILQTYQASRILVWQNPEAYSKSGGYQVLQGLYAIGSGGLFGKGFGNSVQKLAFLPEAQNDMIFSIICEELGLFGAVCVMLLFLFLLYRFLVIANNAPDMLGSMIVIGIMAQIAIQVMMNIAVVTNSMPNTGVSLPFISYGGTSLLFLLGEMGMVLGVSRKLPVE